MVSPIYICKFRTNAKFWQYHVVDALKPIFFMEFGLPHILEYDHYQHLFMIQ